MASYPTMGHLIRRHIVFPVKPGYNNYNLRGKKNWLMLLQTALLFMTSKLSADREQIILLNPFAAGIEIVRAFYPGRPVLLSLWAVHLTVNMIRAAMENAVFSGAFKKDSMVFSIPVKQQFSLRPNRNHVNTSPRRSHEADYSSGSKDS